jgi:hypothetical protein
MPRKYVFLLALSLLVAGCAPVDSLNPLYTDKEVIFDPSLVGEWVSPDPNEKGVTKITELVEFGSKLQGYDITMIDDDGSGAKFHAHLVSLGGQHVLDVVPQSWDASSDSYALHLNQAKAGVTLEPHLLRLGMAAYMEFIPNGGKIQARLRPAHWFFKATLDGKKLRLDYIDDEKLAKAIAQGDVRIRHELLGAGKSKDIVVTAGTREVQQFVLEHINDEKVFTEHTEMERRP